VTEAGGTLRETIAVDGSDLLEQVKHLIVGGRGC
jgi:hypothetical protein